MGIPSKDRLQDQEGERSVQTASDDKRRRYADLYDYAPVAFITTTESWMIVGVNQTAENLLDSKPGALINRLLTDFIHHEDVGQFSRYCNLLFDTGLKQTFELRVIKNNGEMIWVQVVGALKHSDLKPTGWFAVNDITSRKRAEVKTVQAVREMDAATHEKQQMNELQSHLNPHFMFNALSAAIAMCYTDEELAADLLTKISQYLRLTLGAADYEAGVTVKKTKELVELYAEIQKSRFRERLKLITAIDPTLLDTVIIPLVVQPLVENAFRHGVLQKIEGGTVYLRIKPWKGYISIIVSDDGVGMSQALIESLQTGEHCPVGISIPSIDQRVYLQSGKHLKIRSNVGKGTVVRVLLPPAIKRIDRCAVPENSEVK